MGRAHKLTQLQVDRAKKPGLMGDGAGLNLKVTPHGSKSWVFRFMLSGKASAMGLGSWPDVSLSEARDAASEARKLLRAGINPVTHRRTERGATIAAQAKHITFAEAAEQYIKAHQGSWKNQKHVAQWRSTLATYANPIIGKLGIEQVETAHIVKILTPIWTDKTETATRLRGRIEQVLDWATVHKYRTGENPARWRGHLDKLLAKPAKVAKRGHFAALPWADAPTFMEALSKQAGSAARAVEFAILTATRSGEVRGMTWAEVDLDAALWVIPAERMKAGREHRVPLSDQALAILVEQRKLYPDGIVFPGVRGGQLSDMSLTAVLRRMERRDITVHGFRSTFRDWCAESTNHPREVAEQALAHSLPDKVEAAYQRGDMLDKRRALMSGWADYINPKNGVDSMDNE